MSPTDFTAGQRVFVENAERYRRNTGAAPMLAERAVVKVGKRWVTLEDGDRFDPEDMWIDAGDYSPTHRVWLTEAACADFHEASRGWRALCDKVKHHQMPEGVTIADIEAVADILHIDLEEKA